MLAYMNSFLYLCSTFWCISNDIRLYSREQRPADSRNQRYEIRQFCAREGIAVDGWIEETVSGTKAYSKRRLGKLLKHVGNGDLIICSELSRLGRSLYMIMEILSYCMRRECAMWTIKDGYRLGDDIQSKVLAFAERAVAARNRRAYPLHPQHPKTLYWSIFEKRQSDTATREFL